MLDPTSLFTWEPHVDQRTLRTPTMVVTLGSYVDAGHTQRQLDRQLLEQLPNRVLGRFDADQVLDYAG
ncbi:MAG: PAC2 family protein, partial [Propioniciclava sp.]|nr:PAC2 family protein [Propioniciclava sp.]